MCLTDTDLAFIENPGNYAITCDGAYVELSCCVTGYTSIKWYKNTDGAWQEIRQDSTHYFQQNDNNQTFTLQNPGSRDEGSYKCVAANEEGHQRNNTFTLDIRSMTNT